MPGVGAGQDQPTAERGVLSAERDPLVDDRKRLGQAPPDQACIGRGPHRRNAQPGVADLDAQTIYVLGELAVLLNVPRQAAYVGVRCGDQQEIHAVAASLRELSAGLVVRGRLLL